MTWLRVFASRLVALFRKGRLEQELDEEVRSHLEMMVEENLRQGMSPEEARYAALRSFGGVEQVKEAYRERRGLPMIETVIQDVRYGVRMLAKNPGFTAVAVITLALGIGANIAIFSLIDAAMLRTLPVRDPGRLVVFEWASVAWPRAVVDEVRGSTWADSGEITGTSFSYSSFEQLRGDNRLSPDILAFADLDKLNANLDSRIAVADVQMVSGNYYSILGVPATLGRTLTDADDKAEATPVAVITYDFWNREFNLNPSVAGKTIVLNGLPFTIVGVTPPGFFGLTVGKSADVSIPIRAQVPVMSDRGLLSSPRTWWVSIIARLKPGISQQQALSGADVIFRQSLDQSGSSRLEPRETPHVKLAPGSKGFDDLRDSMKQPLYILMILVTVVLLIACFNAANLFLARAISGQREIVMRHVLGATRGRIIRQVLTENILLAMCGGTLGLLFAYWAKYVLIALLSSGLSTPVLDVSFDSQTMIFVGGVTLLTGVLCGLAPALGATHLDIVPVLKSGPGPLGIGQTRLRLSRILATWQVAFCLLLLVCANLFVRTLRNLRKLDPGFDPANVLLFTIDAAADGYEVSRRAYLFQQLLERIRVVPGVISASFSHRGLIGDGEMTASVTLQGHTPKSNENVFIYVNSVGPDFFETMRLPVLLGRGIGQQDTENAPKVAVVNESFVRLYFGHENPIGGRFEWKARPGASVEIVGVVKDATYNSLRRKRPTVFLPYWQDPSETGRAKFELRIAGDPSYMIGALRRAIYLIDKALPLLDLKTQWKRIDESLLQERFFAELSSCLGLVGLVLACLGLYAIMNNYAVRRTKEIGIRMALGANRGTVLRMVLCQGLGLVLVGEVLGIPLALGVARLVSSMLFGVGSVDLLAVLLGSSLLVIAAVFAFYIPARRATQVDPMVALRHE